MKVVRIQLDVCCCDVFLQPLELRRAGDRHDPRLLGEQPGDCDLCRRRTLPLCDAAEQIDECQVRFPRLGIEAGDGVAEVVAVERRAFVDLPGQEALAERAEGDEADSELLESRKDLLFRFAPPERVLALQRGDRLDGMGAADCLDACLREAEVLDLALVDQLLDGPGDVLDRDVRVDAVLVEQIDAVGA